MLLSRDVYKFTSYKKWKRLQKARGLEGKIWAVSGDAVKTNIDQADVLLLGPQVRYMLSSMKTLADERNVGIDVINPMHYGMMNGEAVFRSRINT